MKSYFYDLHIHSCLSPCGDNASTPNSIAGMGELNGLDIMALCDHNTAKNCPAFFEACHRHGVLAVAGMELTTAEDIHLVCLFETLKDAMAFDNLVENRRSKIKNRTDIFGNQYICDSEDNIIGEEEFLLSFATDITIDESLSLVENYNGICFPAHIDRPSNSVTAVLGVFPKTPEFTCAEVHDPAKLDEYEAFSALNRRKLLVSSDAHYLWDIKERTDSILLEDIPENSDIAGKYLIDFLRKRL